METPFYTIDFNEYGQLVSVYDKESRREALAGRMGDKKEVVLKRAIERGALSGIEDVETEEFAELRNNARQIFA